jgi:glycosyltransferase involved in cell wall biosynthesis
MTFNRKTEPFISILTPAYNRSEFLPTLFNSLLKQDFKDFEWVIANDGSDDDTQKVVKKDFFSSDLKITFIDSSHRVGKSKMDNLLLDNAKGKYLCWCDSDDYFTEKALDSIFNHISQLELKKNFNEYIGLFFLNKGTDGDFQTFFRNNVLPDENSYLWQDLEKLVSGDGTIVVHRNLFKGQRFPEVDLLTIESVLLRDLYFNKIFFFSHEVLKIMDRTAENSITHGKKMQYCKGSSYTISKTILKHRFEELSINNRFKTFVNYIRYSFHGDIAIIDQIKNWEIATEHKYLYFLILPIGFILSLRDVLLQKVEKTHILFEKNISIASFKITKNY